MVNKLFKNKFKNSLVIVLSAVVGGFYGVYLNTFFVINAPLLNKILSIISLTIILIFLVFLLLLIIDKK